MVKGIIGLENTHKLYQVDKKVLDQNNPIVIWGSGNQRRNYLHAYDCARIVKIIMEKMMKKR